MLRTAIAFGLITAPVPAAAKSYLSDGLKELKGHPVQEAFDVLGYPDKSDEIEGAKVYSWLPGTVEDAIPCQVKIVANDGRIASSTWSGSIFGCSDMNNRFKKAAKQKR